MANNALISIENLSRSFTIHTPPAGLKGGARFLMRQEKTCLEAVRDLSFSVAAGEKVAFVGPNGAGKSTTLRMLSGLLRPSSGLARVCGFVPWDETKKLAYKIGLVFGQRSALWPALPVRDSLDLLGRIYGLKKQAREAQIARLSALFALGDFLDQPTRSLSLGQRMRADIAAALLHNPDVLFLDEPTIGLDVTAKALLRDHLNLLNREDNTTILLTSHDTDDIERICDRIVVIDRGRKLLDTSLQDLRQHYTRTKTLRLTTMDEIPPYERMGVSVVAHRGQHLVLNVDIAIVALEQVVSECFAQYKIQDIAIENLPLEEVIKTIYLEQSIAAQTQDRGAG